MTRVLNALVKALNDYNIMPRFILIIPDKDILEHILHYEAGTLMPSGAAINWMSNHIIRVIEAKRDFMMKKPGSVVSSEPKCIWIKALAIRPAGNEQHEAVRIEYAIKYNKMMDKIFATKEGHYVLDVNAAFNDEVYFHSNISLNGIGAVRFWKEIDHQLELFDQ